MNGERIKTISHKVYMHFIQLNSSVMLYIERELKKDEAEKSFAIKT